MKITFWGGADPDGRGHPTGLRDRGPGPGGDAGPEGGEEERVPQGGPAQRREARGQGPGGAFCT